MGKSLVRTREIVKEMTEELIECAFQDTPKKVAKAIKDDRDMLVTGVTGSGRTMLIKFTAERMNVDVIEIDCMRSFDAESLLNLFFDSFKQLYHDYPEIDMNSFQEKRYLAREDARKREKLWRDAFSSLIDLVGEASDLKNKKVVVIFKNFSHLQHGEEYWNSFKRKICLHKKVSFALIATLGEKMELYPHPQKLLEEEIVSIDLEPIKDIYIRHQISRIFKARNLIFSLSDDSLDFFVKTVKGHLGDTLALCKRLFYVKLLPESSTDYEVEEDVMNFGIITISDVEHAVSDILEDMNTVFEMMFLLLPIPQSSLLECLALDPTPKPYGKAYLDKHNLSKSGTIQRALDGLKAKGLIYFPTKSKDDAGGINSYRVAIPLLVEWIKRQKRL